MTTPIHRTLLIKGRTPRESKIWRAIQQADYQIKMNMPEQIIEIAHYEEEESPHALWLPCGDEEFVEKLAKLMPEQKKKKHKMVMGDGYVMMSEEVDKEDESKV